MRMLAYAGAAPGAVAGVPLFVFNYTTDRAVAAGAIIRFVEACGGVDLTVAGIVGLPAALPAGQFNLVFIAHGIPSGAAGG